MIPSPNIATIPTHYREGVTVADVIDRSGLSFTAVAATGGSLPAGTYKVRLIPRGNITNLSTLAGVNGRGLPVSAADVVIAGADNAILITPNQAADYDVYVSTDTDPLWVAMFFNLYWNSATGSKTSAYGVTTTTGAVANKIKICHVGEGLAASTYAKESTEYIYPPTNGVIAGSAPINTVGFSWVDFLIQFGAFGESEIPQLVVIPVLRSDIVITAGQPAVSRYFAENPYTIDVNGGREEGNLSTNFQRLRVATHGCQYVHLLVAKIKGFSAGVDIHYILN